MRFDAARARFERRQVALFRDECTIERPSTAPVLDPATGLVTTGSTTIVYTGACLLRPMAWQGTDINAGEVEVRMRGVRAKFPKDTDIERNDVVTATASTHDESLVGRRFRVTDVFHDGFQIVRVAILEEQT